LNFFILGRRRRVVVVNDTSRNSQNCRSSSPGFGLSGKFIKLFEILKASFPAETSAF
jgi:hypothetical protein